MHGKAFKCNTCGKVEFLVDYAMLRDVRPFGWIHVELDLPLSQSNHTDFCDLACLADWITQRMSVNDA